MKKLVTKGFYVSCGIILFLCAWLPVSAQYSGTNLETGRLYTALTKDASNNLYVMRVEAGTAGVIYQIVKYTNGTGTPVSIFNGLTHQIGDYPWGLAVAANGDIYVSKDFTTNGGTVMKLTNNAGTYTASGFVVGKYYSALALDANSNLYTAEYDATNKTYAVVKYLAGSTTGTKLYDNLKSAPGYTYPTGLAVAPNGDVYVADAFSNVPTITDGGHIYKLTAASSYAVSTVSTGNYATALTVDASGNLFSSENRGTGYNLVKYTNGTGAGVPVFTSLHTNGIYYPWGISVFNAGEIFVVDGDDGVHGGAIIKLTLTPPTVVTNAITSPTTTSAILNGSVNDNGNTATVSFIYGTSSTLAGATTTPATTGGTITAGSGNTPVALTITGLTPSTKYYYAVSATNSGGTKQGAILNFTTPPSIAYTTPDVFTEGIAITPLKPTGSTVPAPNYATPAGVGAGFVGPFGVATDATGNIYIADYTNSSIDKIAAGTGATTILASGLSNPGGVAVDATGNVYFSEVGGGDVKELHGGTGTPVTLASGINSPYGVAVDAGGSVYVASYSGGAVFKIPSGGGTPAAFGSGFTNPVGVAVDAYGNVFVADYGASAVTKFPVGGGAAVTLGSGFANPTGVAVDGAGDVYVADYLNNLVKIIRPGTNTPVTIGSGFSQPASVATDAYGNVFVADYSNGAVKEIKPVGGYFLSTALPAGLSFNVNTGVISGTPTVFGPATNYTVTVYNTGGGTSTIVNIAVKAIATLSNLVLSSGALNPAFAASKNSYTAPVGNGITSLTVTPTSTDPLATIKVNGTVVGSGTASGAIPLVVGPNTITIAVTAQDMLTTDTYTVTVTRAASSDAYLNNLKLSSGTLTPGFSSGTTAYTASVGNAVSSLTVTPTGGNSFQTITVNGTVTASGAASAPITLSVGANTVTTLVTAQDGTTTKTYTVTVTRAPSSNASLANLVLSSGTLTPAFATGTMSYTANVVYNTTSITVTPTTSDPTATITVNGVAVTSGSASASISLSVGSNTITTIVTAQDGVTTDTYTTTVTRAANSNLASLAISSGTLSPAFSAAKTSYTASVTNATASITVTPTTSDPAATVTVNGTAVTSGSASGAITLNVGPNTITTVVTASDNTTNTYTITVTRAASSNDYLGNLKLSSGTLTPGFSSGTSAYTASVSNTVTSVTVTPTGGNSVETITVDGTVTASGTASAPIALNVGANTVTVLVTAQDGVTKRTYTITVTRAAPGMNTPYDAISVSSPIDHPQMMGEEINVHPGLSPNGDGINDFLLIDGITNYPDNKLSIMNRSGQLIFETKGYDNSTKVFDGHSNKNGAMQNPGTYFYSLEYAVNGVTKHKTGFIVLKY